MPIRGVSSRVGPQISVHEIEVHGERPARQTGHAQDLAREHDQEPGTGVELDAAHSDLEVVRAAALEVV